MTGKSASQAGKQSPAKGGHSESLTGRRVRVWWPAEREWFEGQVGVSRGSGSKYSVEYDDGDKEVVDFSKEKHELLAVGEQLALVQSLNSSVISSRIDPLLSDFVAMGIPIAVLA